MRNVSVGMEVFWSRSTNGKCILNVLNCRPKVGCTTGDREPDGSIIVVGIILGEEEEWRGVVVVVVVEKVSEGEKVVVGRDSGVTIWPGNGC